MLINFFGLISQDEWEQAETVFKLLALNVSIATAKLKNVQTGNKDEVTDVLKSEMVSIENQIHSLEEKLSAEAIRAPIGGIVLDSYQAGTLCSIANIDTMMVEVPIDPKNRYYIEPGMKFEVKMPALANRPLSGEIISVGQNAQIVTTQYDFYYEKLDGIKIRKKIRVRSYNEYQPEGFAFLGLFISIIYRVTYQGYSYSSSFVNTLVIIAMVTSIVIMVIGNNLARAFGLVGAMSIIRFRTVVKDTRDIAFVFFSLAGGMAAGAGNHTIGLIGSSITGLVLLMFYIINYGTIRRKELLLKFFLLPQPGDESIYLPIFKKISLHPYLAQYYIRSYGTVFRTIFSCPSYKFR